MKNLKSIFAVAVSALVLLFVSGCVATPDGHSKVGVPWKDSLTRRYPRTVAQVTDAARVVLKRMGRVTVDNVVDNSFKAKVNEHDVWVTVTKVDDKTTQLVVMVRTAMGADIDLAAELVTQIALQLTVTQ